MPYPDTPNETHHYIRRPYLVSKSPFFPIRHFSKSFFSRTLLYPKPLIKKVCASACVSVTYQFSKPRPPHENLIAPTPLNRLTAVLMICWFSLTTSSSITIDYFVFFPVVYINIMCILLYP